MATCPECGAEIDAGNVEQGEILPCPNAGRSSKWSASPVTLALAPEEGEDWGE